MISIRIRIGRRKVTPKARRKKRRTSRLRLLLGLGTTAAVLLAILGLHLDVAVSSRFDGRLWKLPSRIYSDVLLLEPGQRLPPRAVLARLERCGYGRTGDEPSRPGQYRMTDSALEVFVRGFETPAAHVRSGRVEVRFRDDRIASIVGSRDEPLEHVVLEPELLATLYGARQEERRIVRIDEVPRTFIAAVLAAEDGRFFSHHGLDLRGILRAAWTNLRHASIVQGGSTITQQTVKNLYLDHRRTWWRKIRETLMAVALDARYDKTRILEVYLNEVYLGQRGSVAICGVQAAARFYFGRDLEDLSLGEAATLAGMIRSPGKYNPFKHPDRAMARRNQVLAAMARLRFASAEEVAAASTESMHVASGAGGFSRAPYVVDHVQSQLRALYPQQVLREDGLRIFTTIDTHVQDSAESALREGLERVERNSSTVRKQISQRTLQGAVVVTRPSSGAILSLVGGRDYGQSQFNRAVQARRQPGSCFKPFVYAAGFELARARDAHGLTPSTLLEDSPIRLVKDGRAWEPANYDHRHRGPVTARRALEESLNVPTVRAAQHIGMDEIVATARRCGIRSEMSPLPSLALGTAEVTPLELAEAYGTFAEMGERLRPWIIRAVMDVSGKVVEGRQPVRERVLSEYAAYWIGDILHGVFERGTARSAAALGYHGYAAGKTGTTDETRDAWFVGYTPEILALVWVGYDDNARTGLTGATGALPIWVDLMKRTTDPIETRARPDTVLVETCAETGMRAAKGCPETRMMPFPRGAEPEARCTEHRGKFRRWLDRLLGAGPAPHRDPEGV